VHDKSAFVHAGLGSGNEVFIGDSAGPGRVYVGVFVKDGFKVLPFTGIAVEFSAIRDWEMFGV
jgi:hypothetical protein